MRRVNTPNEGGESNLWPWADGGSQKLAFDATKSRSEDKALCSLIIYDGASHLKLRIGCNFASPPPYLNFYSALLCMQDVYIPSVRLFGLAELNMSQHVLSFVLAVSRRGKKELQLCETGKKKC